MQHDVSLHDAAFEHRLLLALLNNADAEPVVLNEYGLKGVRLSLTIPNSVLEYLELVGVEEEDDEDTDHSGCGDMEGLTVETRGEPEFGATFDIDQSVAWSGDRGDLIGCIDGGEPSLGWSENHGAGYTENQVVSPRDDREDDAGDDREMDDDREWSLGYLEGVEQHAARLSWGEPGDLEQ